MQERTRTARWLDRILGGSALFVLSFLWFAYHLEEIYGAAALAGLLTALVLYALKLIGRRKYGRQQKSAQYAQEQRMAVYALTMLPYPEALDCSVQALREAYSLKQLSQAQDMQLLEDEKGQHIAVRLHQSPQPASIEDVYALHRARGDALGVLLCAGGASNEALAYAETLQPPLRLIDVQEIPLPRTLIDSIPEQKKPTQRKIVHLFSQALNPVQTLRYLSLGFLLLIGYIVSGRLSCLFPALVLVFLSLICKGRTASQRSLF